MSFGAAVRIRLGLFIMAVEKISINSDLKKELDTYGPGSYSAKLSKVLDIAKGRMVQCPLLKREG